MRTSIYGRIYHHVMRPTFLSQSQTRFCSSYDETFKEDDELIREDEELFLDDCAFEQITPRTIGSFVQGHNVLLLLPRVKFGHEKTKMMARTSPELQVQEAISLVRSISGWEVEETLILPTTSLKQRFVFGKGQNERIQHFIESKGKQINGIFYSVPYLHGWQQDLLKEKFNLPVFDRFSLILQIFRHHATTKEAKLQVKLAEIPYVRSRLRQLSSNGRSLGQLHQDQFGGGDSYYEKRKEILDEREIKLKNAIEKVRVSKSLQRKQRIKNQIPTIAVVGYTNSGKTSLIKSLTQDDTMSPRNTLFATLDVRTHEGRTKNMNKVLFIDTIGFMADIPPALIESFRTSLEEINTADLVVHIQDVSHPDLKNQRVTVYDTLNSLGLSNKLQKSLLEVGNKVDKHNNKDEVTSGAINKSLGTDMVVSATKGVNLEELLTELERRLFHNMGSFIRSVSVSSGGAEYEWLLKNAIIMDITVDEQQENNLVIKIRATESVVGRFMKLFDINIMAIPIPENNHLNCNP